MSEKVAKKSNTLLGEEYIVMSNKDHDFFYCYSCRKNRRTNPMFYPRSNPERFFCAECYNKMLVTAQINQQKNAEDLPEGTELHRGTKRHTCESENAAFIEKYYNIHTEDGTKSVCLYTCTGCGRLYIKGTKFNERAYSRYKIVSTSKMSLLAAEKIKHVQFNQRKIEPADFLTRSTIWKCTSEKHEVKDIEALIWIMYEDHTVTREKIPAFYCKSCDRYYIIETDYRELRKKGVLLCNVVELSYWTTPGNNDSYITNSESLLFKLGYNVSANNNLSVTERHAILRSAIKSGLLTKAEILSHLDYLIRRSQNQGRLIEAVEKWSSDREYVKRLSMPTSGEQFDAKTIIHKHPI